jgi:hypothetical protein
MPTATGPAHLEPVTPDNSVLLLVDQQEGLFRRIHEPELTRRTRIALARCARLLGIPAVMTTALAEGSNGPQLAELTEVFSTAPDHGAVDAVNGLRVRDAPSRTVGLTCEEGGLSHVHHARFAAVLPG